MAELHIPEDQLFTNLDEADQALRAIQDSQKSIIAQNDYENSPQYAVQKSLVLVLTRCLGCPRRCYWRQQVHWFFRVLALLHRVATLQRDRVPLHAAPAQGAEDLSHAGELPLRVRVLGFGVGGSRGRVLSLGHEEVAVPEDV